MSTRSPIPGRLRRITRGLLVIGAVLLWHFFWWGLFTPSETRSIRPAQAPADAPSEDPLRVAVRTPSGLRFLPISSETGPALSAIWSPTRPVGILNLTTAGDSSVASAAPPLDFPLDLAFDSEPPLPTGITFRPITSSKEQLDLATRAHFESPVPTPQVLNPTPTPTLRATFSPSLQARRPKTLPPWPDNLPESTWHVRINLIINDQGEPISALRGSPPTLDQPIQPAPIDAPKSLDQWVHGLLFTPLPHRQRGETQRGWIRITQGNS